MEANVFRFDYTTQHEFWFFLTSDIHFCHPVFDEKLFTAEFDEARKLGARIFINGDVMDLILPSDKKRYTAGNDGLNVDAHLNVAVDEAVERLTPYADNIDIIGCGNHETSPLKYGSTDPIDFLLRDLNRDRRDRPIVHGGYTGFIRLLFHVGGNRVRKYDVYYNHGQGSSSEVTRGAIDLSRRQYISADLIWLGHKHTRIANDLDTEIGLTPGHHIYERKKRGVITGCYLRNVDRYDIKKEHGYRLSYSEQKMRTTQATGGALLKVEMTARGDMKARILI